MTLFEQVFSFIKEALDKAGYNYALAGGVASSLYRKEPRTTQDLDLAIATTDVSGLTRILEHNGFKITSVRQAQFDGGPHFAVKEKRGPVAILKAQKINYPDLDLLLATLPWVEQAVARAASFPIPFANTAIPLITAEDLIVAKFYALERRHITRKYKDLDDLMDILSFRVDLDMAYIRGTLVCLAISLPEELKAALPEIYSKLNPK